MRAVKLTIGPVVKVAAVTFIVLCVYPGVSNPSALRQSGPMFEVASVRQRTDNPNTSRGALGVRPNGEVAIVGIPLRRVVIMAYEIDPVALGRFVVVGGDEDVLSARFDIHAKPPAAFSGARQDTLAMLRNLLAERFGLRTHREVRQLPVYRLSRQLPSQLGPQLRRTEHDCRTFMAARRDNPELKEPVDVFGVPLCSQSWEFHRPTPAITMRHAGPLDLLVSDLQGFVDRPVLNDTGLTGLFDWVVGPFSPDPFDRESISLFTALKQLGLALEPGTGPVEVVVIDSVRMPTPN